MSFKWLQRPRAIVLISGVFVAAAALTAGIAAAASPSPSSSGAFTACLNPVAGTLRAVELNAAHPKTCLGPEVRVSWNQAGQPGAAGPSGPHGATGASGARGPAGPSGPAGAAAGSAVTEAVMSAQLVACGSAALPTDTTCLHHGGGAANPLPVSATAFCPTGYLAMGGGITKTDTTVDGSQQDLTDQQVGGRTGWTGSVNNWGSNTHAYNVYALCVAAPFVPVHNPTATSSSVAASTTSPTSPVTSASDPASPTDTSTSDSSTPPDDGGLILP